MTLPGCSPARTPPPRPNILLVTTDYQSGKDGPSLGHEFLDMPALDRLCREGLVFSRYHSTAPICQPARYTIITGTYPHTHGEQDNQARWVPEGSPILMEHLRQAGYYTMGVGKMHFHPWDRPAGYHRRIAAEGKRNWDEVTRVRDDYAAHLAAHSLTRFDYHKRQWTGPYPGVYDWPFDESLHIDHFVGTRAREVIESDELPSPWFLWVSFCGPHNPWDPPERFSRPYRGMKLPLGKTFPGELLTKPKDHTRVRYNYTPQVVDRLDADPPRREEILHAIRAGHYGNLTFIDRQLEAILSALEKKGLLDATVVIYSSDHGAHLGSHNLIHKGTHYDDSAHVPFVVRYPTMIEPGRVDAFAGHVDLMPTLLSLAGAPSPPEIEGRDLTPILAGETPSLQDHAIIEIRGGTSIITDRWKLGLYPRDGNDGDLYDLKDDPDELINLFYDPEYRGVVEDLVTRMQAVNPTLAQDMQQGAGYSEPVPRTRFSFEAGDDLSRSEAPVVAGKAFSVVAELNSESPEGLNGVLLAQPGHRPLNGYALYVKDGRPEFSVQVWGDTFRANAENVLPAGRVLIEARLEPNGEMFLKVNGRTAARAKAPGPLPVRPGRRTQFAAERLHAGGIKAGALLGDYTVPGTFNGRIISLTLQLTG